MSQFENVSHTQATSTSVDTNNLFQDAYKAVEEHPIIAAAAAVGVAAVIGGAGKSLMDLSEAATLLKNDEKFVALDNGFSDLVKQNEQRLHELFKQSPDVSAVDPMEWRLGLQRLEARQAWLDTPQWGQVRDAGSQLEKLKGQLVTQPDLFTADELSLLMDRHRAMSTMLDGVNHASSRALKIASNKMDLAPEHP